MSERSELIPCIIYYNTVVDQHVMLIIVFTGFHLQKINIKRGVGFMLYRIEGDGEINVTSVI